jgi:dTDP-4-amino-4,6-dideoxygalactose transaminase
MKVPLLDLRSQYSQLKNQILPRLHELMDEQKFILGEPVEQLEHSIAAYCGADHAVGVSSGSDALLLSLMAIDTAAGDIVITSPYTFFATAGSICRTGAMPLFADIDPVTYTLSPEKIRDAIDTLSPGKKDRLKAIMPIHLYGQCADMDPISACAAAYSLTLIEDAAQALGADYNNKKAGVMGDFGCFSFFPSKNLGGFGDGGMITTSRQIFADKLKSLRVHGQTAGSYVHTYLGINGRLDALQAAVLDIKLPYLDQWAEKRRENARMYINLFEQKELGEFISAPSEAEGRRHVFNQFVIRARNREGLQQHLRQNGVGCAVYYPLPLHLQECFAYLGYREGDFPESERAAGETLALPVFPELSETQILYVTEQIEAFYRK